MHLKTFIIEDSPVIRENLVATLEEVAPVQVVGHADDEHTACQKLATDFPGCDLIIVDLFLREGSGINVLRVLHEGGHAGHRVVLTNYATADIRRQCLALGASEVFDKSGEIEALLDYCQRLVDERNASGQ